MIIARTTSAPYFQAHLVGTKIYDLSHLNPFHFEVISTKVQRPIRISVRFTNHCFSEAFDPLKHTPEEPEIIDGLKRRALCPIRYELSHELPGLIRGLAGGRTSVHETAARRNWMYAATVEVPIAGTRYQIFFELRRAIKERRRLQDLEMVVESAYPADPGRAEPNILGRVGFALLAGSLYMGKPVTTRR